MSYEDAQESKSFRNFGSYGWGDPDVDGRIILRWIFRKWEGSGLNGVGSG
jgi:hypothetical protein